MAGNPNVRIKKGDIITATFLNGVAENVSDLIGQGVNPPKQQNQPAAPELQNEDADSTPPDAFTETSRSVSEVQVFDQEETNYALIDRIDQVTFKNSAGETITLVFNN